MNETAPNMKILHVVHGLGRGGLENGVVNLANGLPRDEFQQVICCLDQRGEMADRLDPAITVQVLRRGRHDLRTPFLLARMLYTHRPDLVHCRNWNTWADTVLGHLIAGRPGRLVWSFHGFADGHDFPQRRLRASRVLAIPTHQLMAVCRDSAHRYADLAGIRRDRFAVIYNGVDTERFRPTADRVAARAGLGLPQGRVVLTTVGSLTPVKNHLGLLDAIAAYRRAQPDSPALFLWVGEGALRPRIEQRIDDLGLADQVVLQGPSDRIPEILGASDAFILPSTLEGMSNAILEAMASGLPVIALRVGGNPELVKDGVTGLLCAPGDRDGLTAAIAALIAEPDRRQRMGTKARLRAESEFAIGVMIRHYAQFYRAVANRTTLPVLAADA